MLPEVQDPALENSTMTEYPAVAPQLSPTNQVLLPITTLVALPARSALAKVCIFIGSETVIDAPFVLDHVKLL